MTQNEYIQEIQSKYQITEEKKNIFIVGSPNHNNLGDHAIWYATDKLLHQLYPQYNIVDVSIEDIQTDFEGLSEEKLGEKQEAFKKNINLLYTGCTRAKDELTIILSAPKGESIYMDLLRDSMGE